MFKKFVFVAILSIVSGCLITNCPRGGKRSKFGEVVNIKPCISCGPGDSGQCFGANICCGPFGCLLGTPQTIRCREGFFDEPEPCTAGNSFCRKNTGRCAADGVCCTQESCHTDKSCVFLEETSRPQDARQELDLSSLLMPGCTERFKQCLT